MTILQDDPRRLESAGIGQVAAHWAGVSVTVLAAYAALIWLAVVALPAGASGAISDAVMIELEPITAFEEAPPPAPEPEVAEAPPIEPAPALPEPAAEPEPEPEPEPEILPEPEPVPPEPVLPEPVVEEPAAPPEPVVEEPPPVEKPEPVPEPTTEEMVPDLMETSAIAEAVINPPVPKLRPPSPRPVEKVRVEKKKPAPPKKVERAKPKVEKPRRTAEAKTPPRPSATPRSDRPAATRSAQAPRISTANWQGKLNSHIRRFKRSFNSKTRAAGTARVSLTVDASGRVSGVRIASSSGNAALDAEAIALIRRASPLPAPPEGSAGRTLTLPVRM